MKKIIAALSLVSILGFCRDKEKIEPASCPDNSILLYKY